MSRRPAGAAVLQEDATHAIAAAVIGELAEHGYGRLSIEAVARRAGVGKTTVYRRWPTKEAMVVAVLAPIAVAAIDIPDTGALRSDLRRYLADAATALEHPLASRIIPDILAEAARSSTLADALLTTIGDARREKAALLVRRAIDRGELPADTDVELALDMIGGPLYWRMAVVHGPRPADYLDRLTDRVVAALRA
jgi:AcrR family transcriptional regulator